MSPEIADQRRGSDLLERSHLLPRTHEAAHGMAATEQQRDQQPADPPVRAGDENDHDDPPEPPARPMIPASGKDCLQGVMTQYRA
jgi:hypothetical protein